MIPENNQPSLAGDLLRIHRAITRGLNVAITRGSEFLSQGFPDQSLQQGFTLYLQTLTSVISAHHLGEDEVAFPALQQKITNVPYDRLEADHITIETELAQVKSTLAELAGVDPNAALLKAVGGLKNIQAVWAPHIEVEQSAFSSSAIAGAMSPGEQAQVAVAFAKHSQEHVGPPFFALPFVLFNLAPADRSAMAAMMPKMVIEQLIAIDWKEKWAPMKPFLLD